jgi:hypothetical protein
VTEPTTAPAQRVITFAVGRPLLELERDAIVATLEWTGGNKKEAARALGISRSALYAKLARFGLTPTHCERCNGEGHAVEACPTPAPAEPLKFPPTTQDTAPPPAA